jgi:hypothetical protein
MPKITQHYPNFCEGFKAKTKSFESLEELLSIKWVDKFSQRPNFHQFSISKYSDVKGKEYILMAEYDNGNSWFVVGYLDDSKIIEDLPVWEPKEPNF